MIMSHNNKYYKLITSNHNLWDLKLREVWKYRDLIILFTKRNFQITYKQTILGPAWLFINPIISSLIYCFIFGGIAGMDTDGILSQWKCNMDIFCNMCYAECIYIYSKCKCFWKSIFSKINDTYFKCIDVDSNVSNSNGGCFDIFNVLYNKWISYAEFTNMFYNSNYFNTVRYNGDGNRNYCIQFNN